MPRFVSWPSIPLWILVTRNIEFETLERKLDVNLDLVYEDCCHMNEKYREHICIFTDRSKDPELQHGAELPFTQSSSHFMQEMHCIFGTRSTTGHDAGREILRLQQGSSSVSDYAIEFQTLATDSGWEGRALVDSFLHGLSEQIKDDLLTHELPEDLDRIIALAI